MSVESEKNTKRTTATIVSTQLHKYATRIKRQNIWKEYLETTRLALEVFLYFVHRLFCEGPVKHDYTCFPGHSPLTHHKERIKTHTHDELAF